MRLRRTRETDFADGVPQRRSDEKGLSVAARFVTGA